MSIQIVDARRRPRTCQQSSPHVTRIRTPIMCGEPATTVIDNGDEHPYYMCEQCATYNIDNYSAVRLA